MLCMLSFRSCSLSTIHSPAQGMPKGETRKPIISKTIPSVIRPPHAHENENSFLSNHHQLVLSLLSYSISLNNIFAYKKTTKPSWFELSLSRFCRFSNVYDKTPSSPVFTRVPGFSEFCRKFFGYLLCRFSLFYPENRKTEIMGVLSFFYLILSLSISYWHHLSPMIFIK